MIDLFETLQRQNLQKDEKKINCKIRANLLPIL